jgi:hypothetical protein
VKSELSARKPLQDLRFRFCVFFQKAGIYRDIARNRDARLPGRSAGKSLAVHGLEMAVPEPARYDPRQ